MNTKPSLVGKVLNTEIRGTQAEDGFWTVVTTMTETHMFSDGTEKTEKIDAMCMDRDYNRANETALATALIQYRVEVLDRNFSDLVEARSSEKEVADDTSNDNTNTYIQ